MQKYIKLLSLAGLCFLLYNCTKPSSSSKGTTLIMPTDSNFVYQGRIDFSDPKALKFAYTGVMIRFRFEGSTCIIHLKNRSLGKDKDGKTFKNYYTVVTDQGKPQTYAVANDDDHIKIRGLGKGIHEVSIYKKTEALVGEGFFEGVEIEKDKKLLPASVSSRKMEFIGNSITCGYGNEGDSKDCTFSPETENGYLAYGALTARKLGADYTIVAYSGKGMYRNVDGKTSETMSLIYDRIFPDSTGSVKWNYKKWQPDVIVLNLGTNDFVKGIPDSITFVNTYVNFLKRLKLYYPSSTIICLDGPMVTDAYPAGSMHLTKLRNYILASKRKFDAGGTQKIYTFSVTSTQPNEFGCDWHPNLKRHEKMSDELSKYIRTIMQW
ncbi:MAG TPA: SGNH/GDSL hydrolase family protein [Cytophagaceae bacterium]|nr:SGNH/GDSL hydrolase family protein [Cytophagaceae bacterium]